MKTLTTALCTTLLLGSALTATTSQAADFSAADNSPSTKLCMAVVANKPLKLYSTMKDMRINKRRVAEELHCNKMNVTEFANTYGFARTAGYLNLELNAKTSIHDIAMRNSDEVLVVAGSK